jgi:hypothetical protein
MPEDTTCVTISAPDQAMISTTNAAITPEGMAREDQLCLLLARGQLTPEVRSRILETLATPLQWPQVLERAYSHQVYPLLYRSLRELGFPGVPETVQTELKGAYLANAMQPVARRRTRAAARVAG